MNEAHNRTPIHSTRRDLLPASADKEMAAQEADMMMTVSQLEKEVGNGTYIFRRPLTIVQCAVQDKFIVYPSCQQCNKRVSPENNGFVCPIHRWQSGVVYQFAMRILLQDAIGSEVWATLFNAKAVQVLGYTANDYMNMKSDAERYAALDMLRGGPSHGDHSETPGGAVCKLHGVRLGSSHSVNQSVDRLPLPSLLQLLQLLPEVVTSSTLRDALR